MRRLLIAVDDIRERQQNVMAGCRGDAELAVSVTADLQSFEVREPR
jgi:hypothetical protein